MALFCAAFPHLPAQDSPVPAGPGRPALAVAAAPDAAAAVSGRCVTAGSAAVLLGPLLVGRLADVVGLREALLVLPLTVLAAGPLLRRASAAR